MFFCDEDYEAYIGLMAERCCRSDVAIWAYCLMPNHVHLIVVPSSESGLRNAIGEGQGRFASYPMNEPYLLAALRDVELNPVRARLVESPEVYPWSSAAAHLTGRDDALVKVAPLLELVPNWVTFLSTDCSATESEALRRHERTGRPLRDDDFITRLEAALGRSIRRQKPGPKGSTNAPPK
jgi:putative transposase